MKQVFIKIQSSLGQSWANSAENINYYVKGVSTNKLEALKNINDYEQQINIYTQISNNLKLTPNNGNFNIEIATRRIGIEPRLIDMSEAFKTLTTQNGFYEAVHFGYIFGEDGHSKDFEVIRDSLFFARDSNTNRFVNAITKEEISDKNNIEAAVLFTLYRIRGTHIYYMVVNPNLVSVPKDLSGTYDGVKYSTLDTSDSTFRNSVFAPDVTNGKIIGDNIIICDGDKLIIDTFGLSMLHYDSQDVLDENLPPKVEMVIESSVPYTRKKNIITLNMSDKNIASITYQWITGTGLDSSLRGDESLRYNYVIIKQ